MVREVVADRTAPSSAEQGVMAGEMASHTPNNSAFQASTSVGGACSHGEHGGGDQYVFHLETLK